MVRGGESLWRGRHWGRPFFNNVRGRNIFFRGSIRGNGEEGNTYRVYSEGFGSHRGGGSGRVSVFVENIPWSKGKGWLWKTFKNFGWILDIYISRRERQGKGGTFGFVRFGSAVEATKAEGTNDYEVEGMRLFSKISQYNNNRNNSKRKSLEWRKVINNGKKEDCVNDPLISGKERKKNGAIISDGEFHIENGKINEDAIAWCMKCAVAKLDKTKNRERFDESVLNNINGVISTRALDPTSILVEFKDVMSLQHGIGKLNDLECVIEAQPWEERNYFSHRTAIVKCIGLPIHGWARENFRCMSKPWGEFLGFVADEGFQSIKLKILTQSLKWIQGHISIQLGQKSYEVFLIELMESDMENMQSDESDDEVDSKRHSIGIQNEKVSNEAIAVNGEVVKPALNMLEDGGVEESTNACDEVAISDSVVEESPLLHQFPRLGRDLSNDLLTVGLKNCDWGPNQPSESNGPIENVSSPTKVSTTKCLEVSTTTSEAIREYIRTNPHHQSEIIGVCREATSNLVAFNDRKRDEEIDHGPPGFEANNDSQFTNKSIERLEGDDPGVSEDSVAEEEEVRKAACAALNAGKALGFPVDEDDIDLSTALMRIKRRHIQRQKSARKVKDSAASKVVKSKSSRKK